MSNLESLEKLDPAMRELVEYQTDRLETAILRIFRSKRAGAFAGLSCIIPRYWDLESTSKFPTWMKIDPTVNIGLKFGYNPMKLAEQDGRSVLGYVMKTFFHPLFKHHKRIEYLKNWCEKEDRLFLKNVAETAFSLSANELLIDWGEYGTPTDLSAETTFHRSAEHTRSKIDEKGARIENPLDHLESLKSADHYFKVLNDELGNVPGTASQVKEEIEQIKQAIEEALGAPDEAFEWMDGLNNPEESGLDSRHERMLDVKIQEAVDKSRNDKTMGTGSMKQQLEKMYPLESAQYNWESMLHRAIKSGKFMETAIAQHRTNKRFASIDQELLPVKPPARVPIRDHNLVMIVDTSGSMSPKDITTAYEMILSLKVFKPKLRFFVIEWDYVFQREFEIKTQQDIIDNAPKCQGRGGTTFAPAIKYAVENYKPDTLIYATDGYGDAGSADVVRGVHFIWMLTKNSTSPCDWGIKVPLALDTTARKSGA